MRAVFCILTAIMAWQGITLAQLPFKRDPTTEPTDDELTAAHPRSSRLPEVVWKRSMTPKTPAAEAAPSNVRVVAPANPLPAVMMSAAVAPPPPARSRAQMLRSLESLKPGVFRTEVIAQLGPPAYSIGIPDGGHFIERCRFRSGFENVATIEFRDGYISAIDRFAH